MSFNEAYKRDSGQIYEHTNLTSGQILMWVEEKLQPEVPIYSQTFTFTFRDKIDPEHFRRAFQTLLNSSDALRSVIEEGDGLPHQRVLEPYVYPLEGLDISQATDRQTQLETWVHERSQVRFDLTERLFDSALVKISDDEFVWYFKVHHIIFDGWSLALTLRWMSDFYDRSVAGDLPDRRVRPAFGDYIEYDREYRRSARYSEAIAYWESKLAQDVPPLTFYGHAKSQLERTTSIRVLFELGRERTEKLKAMARCEDFFRKTLDVSLFNIFAALLYTYLYLVSRNRVLSIGAPFHNRRARAFTETIGMFLEVHPLRLTIEDGATFLSLIRKVSTEAVETLRYSESLPHWVNGSTYDVLINLYGALDLRFRGTPVRLKRPATPGNNSLVLSIFDSTADSYPLAFDFRSDIFDEDRRGKAVAHFLRILDAFLDNPSQPLKAVDLLSEQDRERILVEFNQTTPAFSSATLAQVFDSQVAGGQDRVAVVFEGHSLTYARLNAEANRLAHYLRGLGVGAQVAVGILMERSVELVVAILGVLKAGGAYVPLDPSYPRERLAFVLCDSQAPVVLTKSALKDCLPKSGNQTPSVVCVDEERDAIARESSDSPRHIARPENLAYVIYTSGSTGRPKGVLVNHRNVIRLFGSTQSWLAAGSTDVWTLFHSCGFDMSVWELWGALLHGGRLVVVPFETTRSPDVFLELIREQQVTVMTQTPSAFYPFVQVEEQRGYGGLALRLVFLGGEALDVNNLQSWFARHGYSRPRLFNAYGPTETTIFTTYAPLTATSAPDGYGGSLIGWRVADLEVYLLEPQLKLAGMGMVGEIYVGGAGVSLGYLKRPDLTGDRFVPNPFQDEPGERLYRTGDMARYRSDGSLEFLGRSDNQVKLRGFRIELGEIEYVLTQHPQVRAAVVVLREEKTGRAKEGKSKENSAEFASQNTESTKRLVAYWVPKEGVRPHVDELRSFLLEKLPEYMVPAVFATRDSLPLTANGKLDRHALPDPEGSRPDLEQGYVEPKTSTEKRLVHIWTEVLGVDRVGLHDNFLALGGHSLLATQVASRIRDAFKVELAPRSIFERPTVAGLANVIETIQWAGESHASSAGPTDERVVGEL